MNTSNFSKSSICLALLCALGTVSQTAQADAYDSVVKAVEESKTTINLRYRFEHVDQDGISEDAAASTLKTRLTWQSGMLGAFSVKLEVDDVTTLGSDDYNSLVNGQTAYPVVADPEGTDINQAYLRFNKGGLTFTGGRQAIAHNDQRFVGGVAWRQNEQTFDGYRLQYKRNDYWSMDYSYIFNVNRIFGPSGPRADLHGELHLFNFSYAISKAHKLALFGYTMDFDTALTQSNHTVGVRYTGEFDKVNLMASYASQSDAGDNPNQFDTDYWAFEAGTKVTRFNVALGYENLGGDNGVGFMTPLATLHKFQGFADKFLGTPGTGVEDFYIKVGTKFDKVGLTAIWHNLEASEGSVDYGTELDLVASYAFNKRIKAVLKYAAYDADNHQTDTNKLWFMLNAKF